MKRDKWTQQLHDKLAEYETAAPDDLWADIEAALDEQPKPVASRPRFVAMRRWAVAASIAALLIGGGYLWWNEQDSQGEGSLAALEGRGTAALEESPLEERGVAALRETRDTSQSRTSGISGTSGISSTSGISGISSTSDISSPPSVEKTEEEKPQRQIQENPQRQNPAAPQRQMADYPHRQTTERAVVNPKRQVTLNLYAMNGLGNQNSSNGVQMADALAKQYMDAYMNSYGASSRSSEPIYLTGFEERQHHHRPVTYGLTLSYPLTDRLSLTSGVVYTKLQSEFTQIMRNQQIQEEQTLHYVGIPVSLSYKLWTYKSFRTYLSAGVKADWNVKTHLETEGVRQELPKDRMQWSFNGCLGLQYDLVPQVGLYVEPSLNWYPDNGSIIQNYFKDKPLSLGLQVGLRLNMR